MGTKVYDNALDLISFSRASGGTALRRIGYGPELVTNGTFDTDLTGWTAVSADVSFDVRGAIRVESTGIFNSDARQTGIPTKIGSVYLATFDVVEAALGSGGVSRVGLWASASDVSFYGTVTIPRTVTTRTTYTFVAVATSASSTFRLGIGSNTGFAVFDNVSVKEVLFDQPDGTLTLFNHPTNIPRIEYAADGTLKGLLVEEARTNLRIQSEAFDNAAWSKSGISVTADDASAPDGQTTADKLVESATTAVHYVFNTGSIAVSAGAYTGSVYAKAAERTRLVMGLWDGANYQLVQFDLTSGTVVQEASAGIASITDVGSGWYRCSVTRTLPAVGTFLSIGPHTATNIVTLTGSFPSYTGDGTSGVYLWGAQLEAGAFPTSYIPTAGATATRAADIASIPVSAFGYNQKAGGVVIEAKTLADQAAAKRMFSFDNGASNADSIQFAYSAGGTLGYYEVRDAGVIQVSATTSGAISSAAYVKSAVSYKENDFAASVNSNAVFSDTSGTVPTLQTQLQIGGFIGGNPLNGHIKSIAYYPRRLSNAQLQELTS